MKLKSITYFMIISITNKNKTTKIQYENNNNNKDVNIASHANKYLIYIKVNIAFSLQWNIMRKRLSVYELIFNENKERVEDF